MSKCVIKSDPQRILASGYTRVRIMPNNYSQIITLAGITGKTIQDIVGELLDFALSETQIQDNNGNIIDFNNCKGVSSK